MSEVAITSESQEGSAATMPELRFDAMMQRFSGTDFERPAERFFPGQSVAELMNRAASLFDMRAAETRAAETRAAHQEALYAVCKRAIDIFISLTAVLFLSPIIVIAGITVKLYDGGPFLFSQIRVGKNGREFRCFKFRSMIVNAEALQSALIDQNDHPSRKNSAKTQYR